MIRYFINKVLLGFKKRYDYDVAYQQLILNSDLAAFLKFTAFQTMASHTGDLPSEILYATRLRTILSEDCGPCAQLVVNMALEANVSGELITAIIENDLEQLDAKTALVIEYTDKVLSRDIDSEPLRDRIRTLWGERGVIAISLAISTYRIYPTLKYALGYAKTCSQIKVY